MIVILGILAVSVLPRFVSLNEDASKAVTKSVQGSFYNAANLFHMKWLAEGQPASILIGGDNVLMSAEGYPDRSTADHAGCLEIWNNLMDTSISIVAFPGAAPTPDWSALRFGPACVYINHGGAVFNNTQTPFFSYFPANGSGAGFNLD